MPFLYSTMKFLLSVGTCVSFLPALNLIFKRKRHFECFIAFMQLLAAVIFTSTQTLGVGFLLTSNDWHMISDITTSTYICLLCIHLLGLRSAEAMILLRYVAFGCSWIAKLADGWGSMAFEAVVYLVFLLPALALMMQGLLTGPLVPLCPSPPPLVVRNFLDRKLNYDRHVAGLAVSSGAAGLACFFLAEFIFDNDKISRRVVLALSHCAFGAGSYYLWQFLPCYDRSEDIPVFR